LGLVARGSAAVLSPSKLVSCSSPGVVLQVCFSLAAGALHAMFGGWVGLFPQMLPLRAVCAMRGGSWASGSFHGILEWMGGVAAAGGREG